jgi:polyhydroxybutyrate depolymerase
VLAVLALGGALFGYFIYTPAPEAPQLSGTLSEGAIEIGGLRRTYLTYVPQPLPPRAPLIVAMHGSGESGARMRRMTGYAFERLADTKGFAVAYPDGFEGYWNGCNIVGDYAANTRDVDDVGFLTAMADRLLAEHGLDPARVFAAGVSRGGHMAYRLALEAPSRFRAVAAVAANVPAAGNFKCTPSGPGTSSVMIMNGTEDPLNPFDGGEVRIFGLYGRGKVRSSRESVQYFKELNDAHSAVEVELVAIEGGGHGLPQPYVRYSRILGPTPTGVDGPGIIWAFFERQ